jgi:hypothetical protein
MKTMMTIAAFGAAAVATPALAGGLTIYTDRASWEAALGGATAVVEDFNSLSTGVISDGATLDTGLIQITRDGSPNGGDGALAISPGSLFGNFDGTNHLDGETGVAPHENVIIGFGGQNIFAFGADWVSPFSGDGIVLRVGESIISLDSITGFNSGFLGFVSDSETFGSVTIAGNPGVITFQELWQADNISYAVPAPGALALLGMAGLVGRRRR